MFDLRIHSAAEAGPRVGGRSARREWHKWAGYLGMGGISQGVRGISQGVGRFHRSAHPIWPLSNTDSIYFRIVLHLR